MREQVKKIALIGMLASLVFIVAMTPLGIVPLGSANLTIMHIPIIIITLLLGVKAGLIMGVSFGLASTLAAFGKSLAKQTILAKILLSYSPFAVFLVSLIPAIVIPLVANYIYKGMLRLNRSNQFRRKRFTKNSIISYSAIGATLSYAIIYIVLIGISLAVVKKGSELSTNLFSFATLIIIAIEAFAAALISAPIVRSITDYNEAVVKSKNYNSVEDEEAEENDLSDIAVMPITESLLPNMNEETQRVHEKCMGFFNSGAYELSVQLFNRFEDRFTINNDRFFAKLYVIMLFVEAYQYRTAELRLIELLKFTQDLELEDSSKNILIGVIKIINIANANASVTGMLEPKVERLYMKAVEFVNAGAYLLAAQMLERQKNL